jgi:hypothetical protein
MPKPARNLFPELAKSIEAWRDDLPHNRHKQEAALLVHDAIGWIQVRSDAMKIGTKARSKAAKPLDLRDVVSPIFNREKAVIALDFADLVLSHARGPPQIIVAGDSEEAAKSIGIELLQDQWMRDSKLRDEVQAYRDALARAVDEYNSQHVAVRLNDIFQHAYFKGSEPSEEYPDPRMLFGSKSWLQVPHDKVREALHGMDRYFYSRGNLALGEADKHLRELNKNETGKLFIIQRDEIGKALALRMRRSAGEE